MQLIAREIDRPKISKSDQLAGCKQSAQGTRDVKGDDDTVSNSYRE